MTMATSTGFREGCRPVRSNTTRAALYDTSVSVTPNSGELISQLHVSLRCNVTGPPSEPR